MLARTIYPTPRIPSSLELPCGDCFADSTPLGFNTLLQGAAHLGRLTGFACKSFSIVSPRGRQLKALCRQLRVWIFKESALGQFCHRVQRCPSFYLLGVLKCGIRVVLKPSGVESAKQSPRGSSIITGSADHPLIC